MFSKSVIMSLMIWISSQTGYPIPEIPNVALMPPQDLKYLTYHCWNITPMNRTVCNTPVEEDEKRGLVIQAIFNDHDQTIYFNQDVIENAKTNLDEVLIRGMLLHELVHYMQYLNGDFDTVSCRRQLEMKAYKMQHRWLMDMQGVPIPRVAWDMMGTNPLTVLMLSTCPRLH